MTEILPHADRRWATPLSWAFGLLWIGMGVASLLGLESSRVLLVGILTGPLILPPVVKRLRRDIPAFRPFAAPPVIALVLYFGGGWAVNWATASKPVAVADAVKPEAKKAAVDSEAERIVAEYAAKNPGERFVDLINSQLLDRVASVSTAKPTSMPEVWTRLGEIETLAVQVREGRATPMSEPQKKSLAKFEAALSAKQTAAFPVLRSAYRGFSKSELWGKDIEVFGGGRTIEYVGVTFARNANIAAVHKEISRDLKRLRFSTATYRWIRDGDGASYDLQTSSDRAIVF